MKGGTWFAKLIIRSTGAILVLGAAWFYQWNQPRPISFRTKYPQKPLKSDLTKQEIEDYKRDGFLLKRNLVRGPELDRLVDTAETIFHSWHPLDSLFEFSYAKLSVQIWRESSPFAQFAFESSLPSMAAQLLDAVKGDDASRGSSTTAVRLLKDAVFGYTRDGYGCDFHLDDKGLWPANEESAGVQYWLALSPMSARQGGGMRVTNRSLTADFFDECLDVIQSEGLSTTCIMKTLSPACDQKMMDASVIHDMQPGDLLIWDRKTFHRSEPFHDDNDNDHKLRYTVRYIPSDAIADGVLHPSVPQGQPFDTPYHPQVWPRALESEVDVLRKGLEGDSGSFFKRSGPLH